MNWHREEKRGDRCEKRGFIKLNLISFALTGGAILALLVALGSIINGFVAVPVMAAKAVAPTRVSMRSVPKQRWQHHD
jgi:hypothetical protein